MARERVDVLELAVAAGMLAIVAGAAGLEGSVVRIYGGPVLAMGALVGVVWVARRGVETPGRLARLGAALLAGVAIWQVLPVSNALRARLAPGQARWMDRVAPEWTGPIDPWLAHIAAWDVDAALGLAGTWSYDILAGSAATLSRSGAVSMREWTWVGAELCAGALIYLTGRGLGRHEGATRAIAVGMLVLGVIEALLGLAWRSGPTTGLSDKTHYLGSATGTFINRGHFAAFLCLSAGCAWGLAASLFPLLPEEVRKHASRQRRSSQPPSVFEVSGDRIPRLALLGFLTAVIVVALVASQSRGPFLALCLSAAFVGAWAAWRRAETFHLGIGAALPITGAVLAIVAFGPSGAFGRFRGLLGGGDASALARITVWRESVPAWLDAPVFGAGLGSFRLVHPLHERDAYLYVVDHAHNELVEWLVDAGVVGLAGVCALAVAWAKATRKGAITAEHDTVSAIGVGASVGVLAVVLQSMGDFPLRTPGVMIPFALLAGVAHGALLPEVATWRPGRVLFGGMGVLGVVLATSAGMSDRGFTGSRDERVGEVARVWYAGDDVKTLSDARSWLARCRAEASATPLDPWTHAAVARAESMVAATMWQSGQKGTAGDTPEDHTFLADLALSRTLALRPRHPRLELAVALSMARLVDDSSTPDAWRERTVQRLMASVAMDAWRAHDAFLIAKGFALPDLQRLAGAVGGDARSRSRVLYEYASMLEQRGHRAEALAAYTTAADADADFGPPSYKAGVIELALGRPEEGRGHLHAFLAAQDRPEGMEGWALLYLEDVDGADSQLRRAVTNAPKNRWAWEGLAEVARRRQDRRSEIAAYRKILELSPGDAAVLTRIRTLEASPTRP